VLALFGLRVGQRALEQFGWPGAVAIVAIVAILIFWPRIVGR
jgi:hypothetical protein